MTLIQALARSMPQDKREAFFARFSPAEADALRKWVAAQTPVTPTVSTYAEADKFAKETPAASGNLPNISADPVLPKTI
jgi:hypothetical protein